MDEHVVLLLHRVVSLMNSVLHPANERCADGCRRDIKDVATRRLLDVLLVRQELVDTRVLVEEGEYVLELQALVIGRLDSLDVLLLEEPF